MKNQRVRAKRYVTGLQGLFFWEQKNEIKVVFMTKHCDKV